MRKNTISIFIAGVGGQGVLRFSDILGDAAMNQGFDVKKSEVHGMAQRGGSVTSHVRFGDKVYSPLIPEGKADFLVSLEQLEALRFLSYLDKREGYLLYDPLKIPPLEVSTGVKEYPDAERILKEYTDKVLRIPAFEKAMEIGNVRVQNIVMLGALSCFLDIEDSYYTDAIKRTFKEKFWDINIKGFMEGKKFIKV